MHNIHKIINGLTTEPLPVDERPSDLKTLTAVLIDQDYESGFL